MVIDGHNYGPTVTSQPVLVEDYDGDGWAIEWEDGPDDWANRASMGGTSEEERILTAQANAEFGGNATVTPDEPVTFPAGVHAEPYFSFVLSLHPA